MPWAYLILPSRSWRRSDGAVGPATEISRGLVPRMWAAEGSGEPDGLDSSGTGRSGASISSSGIRGSRRSRT